MSSGLPGCRQAANWLEADREGHQADLAVLAKRISRLTFWLPFEVLGALAAVVAVTEWLRG